MKSEHPTRLVILGAAGRMGRVLLGSALADPEVEVVGAVDAPNAREVGQDVGTLVGVGERGVRLAARLEDVIDQTSATVEFTVPAATLEHLEISRERRKPAVVGTTGLDSVQLERVRGIAREIPVFMAPNMSLGVNVLLKVLPIIAEALGSAYDVEVIEAHHHGKKDAPSGTALRLAEVVAEALGATLPERAVYGRQGIQPRQPGEIGMHAVRAGAIVGDHTVLFANEGEQIEVVHRAYSRQTFALGALRAAKWIVKQPPGFYSMQDLLG
jgi:4-hydroxy-tetrahydrodipicolinate reductase